MPDNAEAPLTDAPVHTTGEVGERLERVRAFAHDIIETGFVDGGSLANAMAIRDEADALLARRTPPVEDHASAAPSGGEAWTYAQLPDEFVRRMMAERVGMPNSQSLHDALRQVETSTVQAMLDQGFRQAASPTPPVSASTAEGAAKPIASASLAEGLTIAARGLASRPEALRGPFETNLASPLPQPTEERAAGVDGWQDISTAPKDRTVVLGAWLVSRTIWVRQPVFWGDADGWVASWDSSGGHPVSHWMPLPAPPALTPTGVTEERAAEPTLSWDSVSYLYALTSAQDREVAANIWHLNPEAREAAYQDLAKIVVHHRALAQAKGGAE